MDDDQVLTQEATQQLAADELRGAYYDQEADISTDGICILEPITPAADHVVRQTLVRNPRMILSSDPSAHQHALDGRAIHSAQPRGLVLRLSYLTSSPSKYFTFGRVPTCDVVFEETTTCFVSKQHFRIFLTAEGILMLEETSLNGTVVDGMHMQKNGAAHGVPNTRILCDQTRIAIMIPTGRLEFAVRMPMRYSFEQTFIANFNQYVSSLQSVAHDPNFALSPTALCTTMSNLPALMPGNMKTDMVWNGGPFYNPLCKIASGAFGTVFKVVRKTNGEILAVKEIFREKFLRPEKWERVKSEITIMQGLDHPNIVRLLNSHDIGSHLYMVMDYIPNGTLLDWIMQSPIPECDVRPVARQILSALDYLHSRRITHRDIKPDNILVVTRSPVNVKLTDFGLSKALKTDASCLMTFCGTLYYCAPEVHPESDSSKPGSRLKRKGPGLQPKSYGSLVDIWSFGAVLWYSLCGQQPFPLDKMKHPNQRSVYEMITTYMPDTLVLRRFNVSPMGIQLLLSMMRVDPSQRPTPADCLNNPWLSDGSIYISPRKPTHTLGMNSLDRIEEELGMEADNVPMPAVASSLSTNGSVDAVEIPARSDGAPKKAVFALDEIERFNRMVSILDNSVTARQARCKSPSTDADDSMVDYDHPVKRQRSMWWKDGLAESNLFNSIPQFSFAYNNPPAPDAAQPQDPAGVEDRTHPNVENEAGLRQVASAGFAQLDDDWFLNFSQSLKNLATVARPEDLAQVSPSGLNIISFLLANSHDLQMQALIAHEQPQNVDSKAGEVAVGDGLENMDPVAKEESQRPLVISSRYSPILKDNRFLTSLRKVLGPDFDPSSLPNPLGILQSSTSSIHNITVPILGPFTSWGRHPSCTVTYPYPKDTRVSKVSFALWFHVDGMEGLGTSQTDPSSLSKGRVELPDNWMSHPGLHTVINTYSRFGIYVNNVHLPPHDPNGNVFFGRLYTGDRIAVFCKSNGELVFECSFAIGAGAQARPENEKPFVIQRSAIKLPELIYVPAKLSSSSAVAA